MKVKFRVTQLTLFLMILIPVVITLSTVARYCVRFTGEDLGDQLVDQTSARIEQEIQRIIDRATDEASLLANFIDSGRLDVHDFAAVVDHMDQILKNRDESTSMFVALADTGECIGISRLTDEPTVWQLLRSADRQGQVLEEFNLRDYPQSPLRVDDTVHFDMLQRPWYLAAQQKGEGVWPESYVFIGAKDTHNDMGVTYARPVYDSQKNLLAVVSTDYSLQQLSKYLRTMRIGEHGYAFVVEMRNDGTQAVIAHPNPDMLLRTAGGTMELIPVAESPDPLVVKCFDIACHESITCDKEIPVHFENAGNRFIGEVRHIGGVDSPHWLICIVLPEDDILGDVHRVTAISSVLAVSSVAIVVLLSMYLSSQVAIPLEKMAVEAEAIGRLDLAYRPLPRSIVLEVDRLAVATDEMKTGLRSFQKFVPPAVVRKLLGANQEAIFGGERRYITLLFSDIVNFTSTAESLAPEELVQHLRRYLTVVSDAIFAADGTVDKFIGDAVMAFWGAPHDDPDHALAACKAALMVKAKLEEAQTQWRRDGLPEFQTRFGINTGEAIVGNIGSDMRLSYTAIGDAVNLASRLEGLNKEYGTHIMISAATRAAAGDTIVTRPLDFVNVKGKQIAIPVFELIGLANQVPYEQVDLSRRAEAALDLFHNRAFESASRVCEEILHRFPDDVPTQRLYNRCLEYEMHPPAEDWNGTFRALTK